MNERPADIEGTFHLLKGGRSNPVASGYRPQHELQDNYLSSGEHAYPDRSSVAPGETARVEIRFMTPEVYPRCLWVGRKVAVYEGSRRIGEVEVFCVHNSLLLVSPLEYKSKWEKPDGLQNG